METCKTQASHLAGFMYVINQVPAMTAEKTNLAKSYPNCGMVDSGLETGDSTPQVGSKKSESTEFNYFIDRKNDEMLENKISNRHRYKILKRMLSDELNVEYSAEKVMDNAMHCNTQHKLLKHRVHKVCVLLTTKVCTLFIYTF